MAIIRPRDLANLSQAALLAIGAFPTSVLLCQRMTAATPGVADGSDYDPIRGQVVSSSGPTFGVGRMALVNGVTRYGYLAGTAALVGIRGGETTDTLTEEGYQTWTPGIAFFQAPVALAKGDLLVAGAVRYVVADALENYRAYGALVFNRAALEQRDPADVVYTVPLT